MERKLKTMNKREFRESLNAVCKSVLLNKDLTDWNKVLETIKILKNEYGDENLTQEDKDVIFSFEMIMNMRKKILPQVEQ